MVHKRNAGGFGAENSDRSGSALNLGVTVDINPHDCFQSSSGFLTYLGIMSPIQFNPIQPCPPRVCPSFGSVHTAELCNLRSGKILPHSSWTQDRS